MTDLVVDTSAIVALLLSEPEAPRLVAALDAAHSRVIAAPTLVESHVVLESRLGPGGAGLIERLLRAADIEVVAFDQRDADAAVEGWRRYGKGRHRASLNLGDLAAYGVAYRRGASVLFVGDDFGLTDVATGGR